VPAKFWIVNPSIVAPVVPASIVKPGEDCAVGEVPLSTGPWPASASMFRFDTPTVSDSL
jgi:hypothetical protein